MARLGSLPKAMFPRAPVAAPPFSHEPVRGDADAVRHRPSLHRPRAARGARRIRLSPAIKGQLTLADGSTKEAALTEEFCQKHPYGIGNLTGLYFNNSQVRWRLQCLIHFRMRNPSEPFPARTYRPGTKVPPTTDQELWNDVTYDLVEQLRCGVLQAWGREDALWGRRIEIPSDAWTAILPQEVDWSRGSIPDKGLYCIVVASSGPPSAIASSGVVSTTRAEIRETSTIAAESRCQARLEALMVNGSKSSKTKQAYREEFCRDISHRAFDRAWNKAIEKTGNLDWKKPGRKS